MTWTDAACVACFAAMVVAIAVGLWAWLRPVDPAIAAQLEAELLDRDERLS